MRPYLERPSLVANDVAFCFFINSRFSHRPYRLFRAVWYVVIVVMASAGIGISANPLKIIEEQLFAICLALYKQRHMYSASPAMAYEDFRLALDGERSSRTSLRALLALRSYRMPLTYLLTAGGVCMNLSAQLSQSLLVAPSGEESESRVGQSSLDECGSVAAYNVTPGSATLPSVPPPITTSEPIQARLDQEMASIKSRGSMETVAPDLSRAVSSTGSSAEECARTRSELSDLAERRAAGVRAYAAGARPTHVQLESDVAQVAVDCHLFSPSSDSGDEDVHAQGVSAGSTAKQKPSVTALDLLWVVDHELVLYQ